MQFALTTTARHLGESGAEFLDSMPVRRKDGPNPQEAQDPPPRCPDVCACNAPRLTGVPNRNPNAVGSHLWYTLAGSSMPVAESRVPQRSLPFHSMRTVSPFRRGLLKWVGNKQRFAHEIASYFPSSIRTYWEPFVGSGAVLATLAPIQGVASDSFPPLIEIWRALTTDPELVKLWYADRWLFLKEGDKTTQYERIKSSYNRKPNGADLLFLCRSCYGGIVRFRKKDGFMSTPCGPHNPMHPSKFSSRVDEWSERVAGTSFHLMDYREAMIEASSGDFVYCDPPYRDSQSILYGSQSFELSQLYQVIDDCKSRGALVALSIDGTKKSGKRIVDLHLPKNLFEQEIVIDCGRSMLRRFQMRGQTLERERVTDRLLLTYTI